MSVPFLSDEEKIHHALWYKGRKCFCESRGNAPKLEAAFDLAEKSKHADALWFCGLFAGKNVRQQRRAGRNQRFEIFDDLVLSVLEVHRADPRALCFLGILQGDQSMIKKAADMGNGFAKIAYVQPTVYTRFAVDRDRNLSEQDYWSLIRAAAQQGEPDAIYELCLREKTTEKRNSMILFAAQMGRISAMIEMETMSERDPPMRWFWRMTLIKEFTIRSDMVSDLWKCLTAFFNNKEVSLASSVFVIGRFLQEKAVLDYTDQKVYSRKESLENFSLAIEATDFFRSQCISARKAVDAWCLMACRINNKINRDIRKKIGMLIWDARNLAQYQVVFKDRKEFSKRDFRARSRDQKKRKQN